MFAQNTLIDIDSGDASTPARQLAMSINQRLNRGQVVLWLLSGGSAIDVAVRTQQLLNDHKTEQLHVGLVDERFGPPGHTDSNQTQLIAAGFEPASVQFHPVLGYDSPETAASAYDGELASLMKVVDYAVGLFGIGADGHTAGLLPDSPLLSSDQLFGHYQADDYQRLSVTSRLIEQLDLAVAYATGESKWPILEQLFTDPSANHPAQLLESASELQVFSDVKLEEE